MDQVLTREQFVKVLPKGSKGKLTDGMLEEINELFQDQTLRENFRDNLLSYAGVMQDGRFKIQSYIDAVRYVSHKLTGASGIESYVKTFPDRYQRMLDDGMSTKTISSFSTAYGKTMLVAKITEQTLVPSYVLNQDLYQKALNVQAGLMVGANSEKVRTDAANSLLTHLKMPETSKVELDVSVKQDKSIDELRESTLELVRQQKLMMESGAMNVTEIAHSKLLIEGEIADAG